MLSYLTVVFQVQIKDNQAVYNERIMVANSFNTIDKIKAYYVYVERKRYNIRNKLKDQNTK